MSMGTEIIVMTGFAMLLVLLAGVWMIVMGIRVSKLEEKQKDRDNR